MRRAGASKFTRRSPDTLEHADLTRYFEHLVVQRSLAPAGVRLLYNGIRFFYLRVLGWPTVDLEVTLPKRPQGLDHSSGHTPLRQPVAAWVGNSGIRVRIANPEVLLRFALRYGADIPQAKAKALRVAAQAEVSLD